MIYVICILIGFCLLAYVLYQFAFPPVKVTCDGCGQSVKQDDAFLTEWVFGEKWFCAKCYHAGAEQ